MCYNTVMSIRPVTALFILISIGVYLYESYSRKRDPDRTFFSRFCVIPMQVKRGQYYRLLTAAFLHVSPYHLLMNMAALYNIGSFLEMYLGSLRFLVALVVSIIGGNLLVTYQTEERMRTVGMSGGIYGLMMIYFLILYKHGLFVNSSIRYSALRTIAINVAISFLPGVSLAGHAGGSLAGILIGLLFLYI